MNTLESCTIDSPNNKTEECAKFIIDDGSFVYSMVDVMVVDRDYTFSCWIKSEAEGNILIRDTTFPTTTDWTYCTHTFTATGTDLQLAFVTEGTYYIYHAQLEIGTKATDWTPAVEDVDEGFEQAKSLIQQLSNQISMLVVDENGSSLMTQTADGWQFSLGGLQTAVSNAQDALDELKQTAGSTSEAVGYLEEAVEDLAETSEYIHIGTYEDEPCIELGESDSSFKLIITNTRIMFTEGTAVPAYINNQSLHIKKATVEDELRFGQFVWKNRANGNMGLIWQEAT